VRVWHVRSIPQSGGMKRTPRSPLGGISRCHRLQRVRWCAGGTPRRRVEAFARAAELRRIDRPYLYGLHTYWRTRMAALLRDKAQAVDLIREAFAQGWTFTDDIHSNMDLEPLADDPAFRELMRPKD
jgi:hypothetical protein